MKSIVLLPLLFLLLARALAVDHVEPRIVGGKIAPINQVPYLVNIRYKGEFFCGGTLVSPRHVVTAAHCVVGKTGKLLLVTAGATELLDKGSRSRVSRITVPSKFRRKTLFRDVAVLRLSKPLKGQNISPLSLCNSTLQTGSVIKVSGWGLLSHNSTIPPNYLRTVELPIIEMSTCEKNYNSRGIRLSRTMFCAARLGKDACSGDSGGPAVYRNQLCGVVSFGKGCANITYPGVYTNINMVRNFINIALKK